MRRWSPDRAQTEPIAAIVAVFAVCLGLLTYTGVLGSAMPQPERTLAPTTLSAVRHEITSNGIVRPDHFAAGLSGNPDGYRLNVSLATSTGSHAWHEGPTPPENQRVDTQVTTGTVSVRIAPGDVRPGTLRVVIWK